MKYRNISTPLTYLPIKTNNSYKYWTFLRIVFAIKRHKQKMNETSVLNLKNTLS